MSAERVAAIAPEDGLAADHLMLLEEGSSVASEDATRSRNLRKAAGLAVAALALVGVSAVAIVPKGARAQPDKAAVDENMEKVGVMDIASSLADSVLSAGDLVDSVNTNKANVEKLWDTVNTHQQSMAEELLLHAAGHDNETLMQHLSHSTGKDLFPPNHMSDKNICPDQEEEHMGLCYKKCSTLTDNKYPIRTTAFSCCKEEPCSFFNSEFSNVLEYCDGLDVAGNFAQVGRQKVCPHKPGDCLLNEEFNLGVCYKRCALLTGGTHPYRFSGETCCLYDSHMACLAPENVITNSTFNIGGGLGDMELEPTMGEPHNPVLSLTEGEHP